MLVEHEDQPPENGMSLRHNNGILDYICNKDYNPETHHRFSEGGNGQNTALKLEIQGNRYFPQGKLILSQNLCESHLLQRSLGETAPASRQYLYQLNSESNANYRLR